MMSKKVALLLTLFVFSGVFTGTPAKDDNVVRSVRGKYLYRIMDSPVERGYEDWYLTIHVDGSRTMRSNVQLAGSGIVRDTVQSLDPSMRPREAFQMLWVKGKFVGSAFFTVFGDKLHAVVNRPGEDPLVQETAIPKSFSLVTHPLSGDGWHFWYYDRAKGGEQELTVYNLDTFGSGPQGLLGKIEKHKAKLVGEEEVTVPAGKFKTRHYEFGGVFHMWVTGEDQICAKLTLPSAKLEYLLSEYRETR
ncbi:MAG: hypothetical protein HY650_05090 [Acidobacteria bacterium]|nr:hypothetical protein [Acidobacteriota bacterium]